MPPKGGRKESSRPPPRRSLSSRQSRRRPSKTPVIEPEPDPVEISEPENKREKWLDELPPVIKPDEELHKQLMAERKQKKHEKVVAMCQNELIGILRVSFAFVDGPTEGNNMRSRYIHGELEDWKKKSSHTQLRKALLEPFMILPTEEFLKTSSESLFDDLSSFFGIDLKRQSVKDSNKEFSAFVEHLQELENVFLSKYQPFQPIDFNGILCVTGIQGGGKTTICQLLAKVLKVEIIQVMYVDAHKKKGEAPQQPTVEYPIPHSQLLVANDEKSAVQKLVQIIGVNGGGYIISGFPQTKGQLIALNKALRPQNPRDRSIGVIFALNINSQDSRKVDPQTGSVYSDIMTLTNADLLGIEPLRFDEIKQQIADRLIPQSLILSTAPIQRQIAGYQSLENAIKNDFKTTTMPTVSSQDKMVSILDEYLQRLLQTEEHFVENLVDGQYLLLPKKAYGALEVWRKCIEDFGQPLADQLTLINSLPSKLPSIVQHAIERFYLWILKADNRKFDENSSFEDVWNEAICNRDRNIKMSKVILMRSGLLQLAKAAEKSPRIVFVSLIHKFLLVNWFYSILYPIDSEEKQICTPPDFSKIYTQPMEQVMKDTLHSLGLEETDPDNFFQCVASCSTSQVIVEEALTSEKVYMDYCERVKLVRETIKKEVHKLKQTLIDLVHRKTDNEMNVYSENIGRKKKGEFIEHLYVLSTDLLGPDLKVMADLAVQIRLNQSPLDLIHSTTIQALKTHISKPFMTTTDFLTLIDKQITDEMQKNLITLYTQVIASAAIIDINQFFSFFESPS